jgi:ABC-type Mn/Zn transport systems, ATPase component
VVNKINHHNGAAGTECSKLCCTKIKNFSVSIGNTSVFSGVNLHIHCGQLTAVIGPNGAGKSTLLRAILGEIAHSGELQYVDAKGNHTGNPIIGYVPQHLRFDVSSPTSVLDLFMASLTRRPVWLCRAGRLREQIERNLRRVKAEHLIERRLGALSGGELQRVLLALALDPLPDLLLLDEPVSGVDQNGLELFYAIVAELRAQEDMAIILVSHDLNLVAKHADQVVLLNKQVICSGSPQAVFSDAKTREIFGMFVAGTERGQAE